MMPVVRACQVACVALACVAGEARAEETAPPRAIGDTAWALPGIVRVGIPDSGPRRVAIAGSVGYGLTEAQSAADGIHHRFLGSAAAAVAPLPALELALRLDGRYDHHPDDGSGAHDGAVGDPRILARYGVKAGKAFRLGLEAVGWFPGKDAPSVSFNATTVDARVLAAWVPDRGPMGALSAGFRFDQSANAAPAARNLIRPGDRLALGLSDFNALLVGAGVAVPVKHEEILGELSADFLVGSGAPGLGKSPMRVTAGVRHHVSPALALQGLLEVSPSGRPELGPTGPLVPVEPRFSILFGLEYRLPFDRAAASTDGGSAPIAAPLAESSALVVHVVAEDGSPESDATVTLVTGGATLTAMNAGNGSYRFDTVPIGSAKVSVSAEGVTAVEETIDVGPNTSDAPLEVHLKVLAPAGQIRGLIRSFAGKGLLATIRVDPNGTEVKADAAGAFTIDVPPGDYEVTIRANRFKAQHRKVHVDQNGVTVINAELFEGK